MREKIRILLVVLRNREEYYCEKSKKTSDDTAATLWAGRVLGLAEAIGRLQSILEEGEDE